jgi:hypothetical protein
LLLLTRDGEGVLKVQQRNSPGDAICLADTISRVWYSAAKA